MKKYSQCDEDLHIANYFKDFKGRMLSIGENDGKTFSNSLRLIELGWRAVLVEPSPKCCEKIKELHGNNRKVTLLQFAIGLETCESTFHESGILNDPALKGAENISLVSTLVESEKSRWNSLNMQWNEYKVHVLSWFDFLGHCILRTGNTNFDFITIDAEGVDIDILKQIDLSHVKLLCIEWNSIPENKIEILNHTKQFGMENIIYQSGENLLIAR